MIYYNLFLLPVSLSDLSSEVSAGIWVVQLLQVAEGLNRGGGESHGGIGAGGAEFLWKSTTISTVPLSVKLQVLTSPVGDAPPHHR